MATEPESAAEAVEIDEAMTNPDTVPAENETCTAVEPVSVENEDIAQIKTGMERLTGIAEGIVDAERKTTGEIHEIRRLYHDAFATQLKPMQEELERYREAEKGRLFDGILTEIAKLYSNNSTMVDEVTDEKLKKRLDYMFQDMLEILQNNNVGVQKSKAGDKRNTRHCQVINRMNTDNPELHDTVVSSRNTGFYVENRSLVREMVDVYIYKEDK
jgi:hypothetical protein